MKFVPCAVALCLVAAANPAQAATMVQTASGAGGIGSFVAFDTGLGTLTSVTVSLQGAVELQGWFFPVFEPFFSSGSSYNLDYFGSSSLSLTADAINVPLSFALYDGHGGFVDLPDHFQISASSSASASFFDGATLAGFIAGPVDFSFLTDGYAIAIGDGNFVLDPVIAATNVALTYEYSTAIAPVPEPAAWAMLVAGFGLLGAIQRRQARTSLTAPLVG